MSWDSQGLVCAFSTPCSAHDRGLGNATLLARLRLLLLYETSRLTCTIVASPRLARSIPLSVDLFRQLPVQPERVIPLALIFACIARGTVHHISPRRWLDPSVSLVTATGSTLWRHFHSISALRSAAQLPLRLRTISGCTMLLSSVDWPALRLDVFPSSLICRCHSGRPVSLVQTACRASSLI